jgi:HAD superfamily hydrolase (TIGR01509 family)
MSKKLIIFDFFGVMSCEVAPTWLRRHFDEETAIRVKQDIVSRGDSGDLSEEGIYKELGALANVSPDTIQKDWMEIVKINDSLVDFIKSIKNDYKVALLSNATSTFLTRILNKYNYLYELFDFIVISSDVKMVKPDAEIFNFLINKVGVRAEESLMIDDNIANIEGAKAAGIDGILYKNMEEFVKEFQDKTC